MGYTDRRKVSDRVATEIPVTVTTILDSGAAWITNLSEHGALISGASAPVGMQVQIDYRGQTLFGVVAWTEDDRCGVRLPMGLGEGPLTRIYTTARMASEIDAMHANGLARPRTALFGRRGIA